MASENMGMCTKTSENMRGALYWLLLFLIGSTLSRGNCNTDWSYFLISKQIIAPVGLQCFENRNFNPCLVSSQKVVYQIFWGYFKAVQYLLSWEKTPIRPSLLVKIGDVRPKVI